MNKRTHFFIKISLKLYSRKDWSWFCVRDELETGDRLLYFDPSSFDHSSTSFSSWLGLLNRGSLRTQSSLPAAGSQFGILSPTDSNCLCAGYIIVYVHLLPLFFRLFTQVHLLIDARSRVNMLQLRAQCIINSQIIWFQEKNNIRSN